MLSQNDYFARLTFEAAEIEKEQPTFKPIENKITDWNGYIIGTGVYEGGVFCFEINIPREYPFKPPTLKWQTKIFHPNFYKDKICVGILGKDWTAAHNIVQVIESVRFLLSNPNPDDPLHASAATLMKRNIEKFKEKAKQWVKEHASFDQDCVKLY